MKSKSRSRSRLEWEVLCREHAASGLSVQAFAARRGVNARTLSWWRSQLGLSGRRKSARGADPVRFVDLVAPDTEPVRPSRPGDVPPGPGSVRLMLGGVRIDLDSLPPASWLAELAGLC